MRTQLIPLIGQPVACRGHFTSRRSNDFHERGCLSQVFVYRWDIHKTMWNQPYARHLIRGHKNQHVAKIDHLWFFRDNIDQYTTLNDETDLYEMSQTFGFVEEYKRSDGSKDVGLKAVPQLSDKWLDELNRLRKNKQWNQVLDRANLALERKSAIFLTSKKKTPLEMQCMLRTYAREALLALERTI